MTVDTGRVGMRAARFGVRAACTGSEYAVATSRAKPMHAQAVGPVRGDLEVEDRVGQGSDLLSGVEERRRRSIDASSKPRSASVSADLLGRSGDVDESRSQETSRTLHSGNCSRNRRSFS